MSEKKVKSNTSSGGVDEKKKPSKFHTKNKKHQQHSSSRSNKHFMITGQMSGTGFRRKIQTVNDDEDADQEEFEMIQQEENLKRLKYGKRSLVDNSFRFKSEEDDEEQLPEERKNQAKLQHELNRMEKETMMMISNSITLTQSFTSSGISRGLLDWEDEKSDSPNTDSMILSNLFYLDQSKLANLLKDPSISVERRLQLIDIHPFSSDKPSPIHENMESETDLSEFVPFSQYFYSKETMHIEETSSDNDIVERMQEETNVKPILETMEEQSTTQAPQVAEKKQDNSIDILDEIMESETKHTAFILPKIEPVKIDLKSDDILDDLLNMSTQAPSSSFPSHSKPVLPEITIPNTTTTQYNPPISSLTATSTTASKQSVLPEKAQENASDLDDWLDDLIN